MILLELLCLTYPLTDFVSVFFLCHIAHEVIHLKYGFIHLFLYKKDSQGTLEARIHLVFKAICSLSQSHFQTSLGWCSPGDPEGRLIWVFHFLCWTLAPCLFLCMPTLNGLYCYCSPVTGKESRVLRDLQIYPGLTTRLDP